MTILEHFTFVNKKKHYKHESLLGDASSTVLTAINLLHLTKTSTDAANTRLS